MWAADMFGPVALEAPERAMRFLEEAIELAHAMGMPQHTAEAITKRVYGRDAGNIPREIGQAQMTLEVLAKAIGVDADHEATQEFFRIQKIPKEEWQRRHSAKQAIGIATPSAISSERHDG
jgi:hypothetical protein